MSVRKIVLWSVEAFLCWFLWDALQADSPNASAAFWPACAALVAVLLIPAERMEGDTFVQLIKAWKGK